MPTLVVTFKTTMATETKTDDSMTAEEKLARVRAALEPHVANMWDLSGINNEFGQGFSVHHG